MDGRGQKTVLTQLLEERLQMALEQAVPALYDGGKRFIASLAPAVFDACDREDPVAVSILRANAAYLAELIRTAMRYVEDPDAPVVICGGLANRSDLLEQYIREMLEERYRLRFCTDTIVEGAVMCARRKYEQHRKTE